jgi:hypothetical protein
VTRKQEQRNNFSSSWEKDIRQSKSLSREGSTHFRFQIEHGNLEQGLGEWTTKGVDM